MPMEQKTKTVPLRPTQLYTSVQLEKLTSIRFLLQT